MTRVAALGAAWLCLACAQPIRTELRGGEEHAPVRKLAVVALRVEPLAGTIVPEAAPALVTDRIRAALESETKLRVVDPQHCDAVLTGVLHRYSERQGSATGVRHPASVWFDLELRDPSGALLWTGSYEETQAALSEDLGSFARVWERGFRWVTAADLADYGARALVRQLAREVETWS